MIRELGCPSQIPEALKPFEDVIDLLPDNFGSVIIDYHSGDSRIAQALDDYTDKETKVFAIDISHPTKEMAAPTADFALCAGVIEHMNRDTRLATMQKMVEHLKPGGHLVVRFNQESITIMAIAARLENIADIVITPVSAPHDGHQLIFARR